jgi:nitroimidazol reductase NimA-like FMN-containing flavoprotein (pyridoxamine 5'-phosphate oxidase superfamily)
MPVRELMNEEVNNLLAGEHVVRVAYQDESCPYLIPLGYVWMRNALYGVMEQGRKTQIAEENPRVAFQVDTSCRTGLFEWGSVTGEGQFQVVVDAEERNEALSALQPVIAQAPDWWQREQAPRMAAGSLLVWKLTPIRATGRQYEPPSAT